MLLRLVIVAALVVVCAGLAVRYRRASDEDEQLGAFDATGRARWPSLPDHLLAGRPTWVIFTTPLCTTCGAVHRDLEQRYPDDHVIKVDATVHPEIADLYDVRRAPTTVHASADGTILQRHVGVF